MAGSEVMHKEGAPVASWPVTACLSGGHVRAYILAQNDKSAVWAGKLHHHICLNKSFQADLGWWAKFLEEWNGISILNSASQPYPDFEVTSDASGVWGLWRIFLEWRMVHMPMAGELEQKMCSSQRS